jgi:REP element-mobilizing transposase RayT
MSHVKIWLHCVWSVKDRAYYIPHSFRPDLLKHFRDNALDKNIILDHINAHENHVHALINLRKQQNISTIMQYLKGESSFWINSLKMFPYHFAWQDDYFAVSIGQSQVERVRRYIQSQDQHHQRITLDDEIKLLEEKYGFERMND